MKAVGVVKDIVFDKKKCIFAIICLTVAVLFCVAFFCRSHHVNVQTAPSVSGTMVLRSGAIVRQDLPPRENLLRDIRVTLHNEDNSVEGDLRISLYKDDTLVQEWSRKLVTIKSGEHVFALNEFSNMSDGAYYMTVIVEAGQPSPLKINVTSDVASRGACIIEGVSSQEESIAYYSSYESPATQKLDLLHIAFYVLFALVLIAAAYVLIFTKINIEAMITLLVFVVGIFFSVVMTPLSIPDEPHHYHSSYQLSNALMFRFDTMEYGKAADFAYEDVTPHRNTSQGYMKLFAEFGEGSTGSQELIKIPVPRKLSYFVEYLPQAIGITIGRLLGRNFVTIFMLGRLFNLMFYTACVYFALKKVPKFKLQLGLVALLPMALHQAASFSYDGFVNGMAFLLLACILRHVLSDEQVRTKDLIVIGVVGALLTPAKVIYCPIMLLLFFIPKERFGGNLKKKLLVIGVLAAVCLVMMLAFQLSTMQEMNSRGTTKLNHEGQYNYTVSDIIKNPINAIGVFVKTFGTSAHIWLLQTTGYSLSGLTFQPPLWILFGYWLLLILSTFGFSNDPVTLKKHERAVTVGVVLMITALVMLSMFIAWTSNTSPVIQGIQGRYFIPIVPLIVLVLCSHKTFAMQRNIDRQMVYASLVLNISTLSFVIEYTIQH